MKDIRVTKKATTNMFGMVVPANTSVEVLVKGELFRVKSANYSVFYTDVSNLRRIT